MPQEVLTLGGRYVLGTEIASGGMATVWLARDDVLARAVAVKVLHPHLVDDEDFLARFRREALAAARLAHPNIVAIYDTGSEPGPAGQRHYIVMEYCGGGTLAPVIEAEGPFEPDRVVRVGTAICDALGYAHRHGIVHRDVKPANVLITDHHLLKVTDFGIAKAAFASGDVTTTGKILGTVAYLSPEQAAGDEPGPPSDLYALGVVLYEMLAGRPPFPRDGGVATAIGHLREQPPPLRSLRAGIPRTLDSAVMKALEKDPADRFASADEMRDALIGGAGFITPVAPTYAPPPEPRTDETVVIERQDFLRSEGRRIAPVVFLVIGAVAVAILIAALVGTANDDDGGGNGGRSTADGGGEKADVGAIEAQVVDFDPEGGGEEHSDEADLAVDGDPSTFWTTEEYNDPISVLKSGVGLRFDLGGSREVSSIEIDFDGPDYDFEVRASDSDGSSADDFELLESISSGDQETTVEVDHKARYWVVYITDLPGGQGGAGAIGEVRFLGP